MFILIPLWVLFLTNGGTCDFAGVKHLMGEPDYRMVRLHWEADASTAATEGFKVRYCELQEWGTQRCRTRMINGTEGNEIADSDIKTYSTDINGLRMATTYTFEVKSAKSTRVDRADDKKDNVIVIPTKGFSARATQCLPHASEIEVSTGPFFGGRIAVEASDGERCVLDGEPNSPRDTYTLRINHEECGSQVNSTTVATFVLVQENLPILTHSTRRFLVLCSYQPETLTVRAGLNLPTGHAHGHGHGRAQAAAVPYDEEEENGNSLRRSRHLRPARLEAPKPLVADSPEPEENESSLPVLLVAIFMIIGTCGLAALVYRWQMANNSLEADNESIASDVSSVTSSKAEDVLETSITTLCSVHIPTK